MPTKGVFAAILLLALVFNAPSIGADSYKIGPGDALLIQVLDHEDLHQKVTVGDDGTIFYPLLGKVVAAGFNQNELAMKLGKRLAGGYIRDPQVNVEIVEYNSKKVYVLGALEKPWTERKAIYNLKSRTTLLEMIAEVGGPSKEAGDYIVVIRRVRNRVKSEGKDASGDEGSEKKEDATGETAKSADPESQPSAEDAAKMTTEEPDAAAFQAREDTISIKIRIADLLAGDLSKNIELQNGDLILIPPRDQASRKVIIAGDAGRRGPVSLTEGMKLPELFSIVQAPVGPVDKVTVYTLNEEGKQVTEEFLTKEILLGKTAKDFVLQDGDVLFFQKTQQTFYVTGEVKAPGGFYYRPDLTIREALVLAGWVTPEASIGRIKVVRMVKNKWVEKDAKLEEEVEPGDIISVPERWF